MTGRDLEIWLAELMARDIASLPLPQIWLLEGNPGETPGAAWRAVLAADPRPVDCAAETAAARSKTGASD